MAQNYIGINGLVTQSLEEIVQDLTQKWQSIYGADINVEQNSPDGQLINILAQEKKDLLDLITSIYNNLDPDRVIGIPQQILYKWNGLFIKAYTYSYVYIDVNVTSPVNLQGLDENIDNADGTGYTVTDTAGNRWILANSQSLQVGSYTLNFRAAQLGAIEALPNTINVMETIVAGVASVNNPAANYITGNQGESSSAFRLRRAQSMATPSQGFDESLQSQLNGLDTVIQVKVYDNRTDTEVNGIPAHTVWVVVQGGQPDEIGRVIYNNVPPGIPMKGTQSVVIPKQNGDIQTVYYDIPSAVPLYIRMTIKNFGTTPLDADYIKEQLAQSTYNIGETATSAQISTDVGDIIGDTGTPYNITISTDNTDWVEYATPTGLDEYFTISTANINITVE